MREKYFHIFYQYIKNQIDIKHNIQLDLKGKVAIIKILNWIFFTENALKCIAQILKHYKSIYISEFLDNNYKIKIKKNEANNNKSTIGFLFGLLEDQVIYSLFINKHTQKKICYLTEYSISQTSLEQIFNKFAAETNAEDSQALGENSQKDIMINEDLLNFLSVVVSQRRRVIFCSILVLVFKLIQNFIYYYDFYLLLIILIEYEYKVIHLLCKCI